MVSQDDVGATSFDSKPFRTPDLNGRWNGTLRLSCQPYEAVNVVSSQKVACRVQATDTSFVHVVHIRARMSQ